MLSWLPGNLPWQKLSFFSANFNMNHNTTLQGNVFQKQVSIETIPNTFIVNNIYIVMMLYTLLKWIHFRVWWHRSIKLWIMTCNGFFYDNDQSCHVRYYWNMQLIFISIFHIFCCGRQDREMRISRQQACRHFNSRHLSMVTCTKQPFG